MNNKVKCNKSHLEAAVLSGWKEERDELTKVAHGGAGTWGLDKAGRIYYRLF